MRENAVNRKRSAVSKSRATPSVRQTPAAIRCKRAGIHTSSCFLNLRRDDYGIWLRSRGTGRRAGCGNPALPRLSVTLRRRARVGCDQQGPLVYMCWLDGVAYILFLAGSRQSEDKGIG